MSRALAIVLLLGALTFTAGLGRPAISDSDEAFYAEAGREMIRSGDWLTPRYNFEYRFQKPILFYWLVASAFLTAGVGEAAARFWAALSGVGLVLLAYAVGRRWYDELTGLLAGAITATSFGYVALAHLSLPDLPLALFISAAIYGALVALETSTGGRSWAAAAGSAMALACLTKGPVGVLLPLLVLAGIAVLERPTWPVWRAKAIVTMGVFLVLAIPWYVAMIVIHGPAYAQGFFVGDNLERFATSRFNEPRAIWFYLPILGGGMLPWSVFFPLWIAPAWRAARKAQSIGRMEWRLILWTVLPLLFFTASVGKQPRYILPILPPLAVLLGHTLAARTDSTAQSGDATDRLLRGCAIVGGVLLVLLGALLARARPVLVPLVDAGQFQISVGLVMASGVLAGSMALRARLRHIPWALGGATALALVALQCGILAPSREDPVKQMAALVQAHRDANESVGTYQVMVRNLIFYTGLKQVDLYDDARAIAFLTSPEPVLCVIGSDDLERLGAHMDLKIRRLASLPYFDTAAVKLRTLLWPDPSQDITSAVLVTNRP